MIIEKVVDRFMDENTYILGDEKTKKCAVIDPGGSIIDIFNIIKQHGLTVEYIILTHGHGDHICRVPEIKSKTNAKIVAHVNEEEVLIDRNKNLSAQLPGPLVEFDADEYVQEGDIIELGSLKLKSYTHSRTYKRWNVHKSRRTHIHRGYFICRKYRKN